MHPFYNELCAELKWDVDQQLSDKMKKACEDMVAAFDAKLDDAEKGLGDTEIREAMLEKSEHYALIGDKVCRGFKRIPTAIFGLGIITCRGHLM